MYKLLLLNMLCLACWSSLETVEMSLSKTSFFPYYEYKKMKNSMKHLQHCNDSVFFQDSL